MHGVERFLFASDERPTTSDQIPPPPPQINPRNHYLAIARLHECPHFRDDALARQRAALSTNVRNHAERAAVVASVLHLQVRARPFVCRFKYGSRQQFGMRKNIPHNHIAKLIRRKLIVRKSPQRKLRERDETGTRG